MIGLSLSVRLGVTQVCNVCQQTIDHDRIDADIVSVALFGAEAFAQCPVCKRIVDGKDDPTYQARVRRFEQIQAGKAAKRKML